jgi:serine/threonine protein kinase
MVHGRSGYGYAVLSSGAVLSDRYRLDERVATGGMGDVWRGTDLVLGREVAVKVLLPSLLVDPSFVARFRAEARMLAALRHPGIVHVYDSGEDTLADGARADYLVMEYVNGEPLSKRIDEAGRLDVAQTVSVIAQAARALHGAHKAGIVHRDVKPSNLLVQPDGTVVLVDFGVARSSNVTSVTSTNAVPGTVLYMAPEQASGRPVSAATDIYALGAVAYCCLAGSPPFAGDNPLEVAVKHMHDEPAALPDDVPAPVRALIERALAKDPGDRYESAAAFAAAARAATGPAAGGAPTANGAGTAPPARAGATAPALRGHTLPETPVLAPRSGWRRGPTATVAGVAAGGLVAAGALIAVLGFGPDDGAKPGPTTPSASGSASPGSEQSGPGGGADGGAPTGHSGPSRRPSATPSASPAGSVPSSPGGTGGPTGKPTSSHPDNSPTTPDRSEPSSPGAGGTPAAG